MAKGLIIDIVTCPSKLCMNGINSDHGIRIWKCSACGDFGAYNERVWPFIHLTKCKVLSPYIKLDDNITNHKKSFKAVNLLFKENFCVLCGKKATGEGSREAHVAKCFKRANIDYHEKDTLKIISPHDTKSHTKRYCGYCNTAQYHCKRCGKYSRKGRGYCCAERTRELMIDAYNAGIYKKSQNFSIAYYCYRCNSNKCSIKCVKYALKTIDESTLWELSWIDSIFGCCLFCHELYKQGHDCDKRLQCYN